jgi:tRNA(Ile)-lysidine synthase
MQLELERALDTLPPIASPFAIGLSGGPDSAALAILAADFARRRGLEAHAFHVHHGLHPQADAWAAIARDLAARLGLPFHEARVRVDPADPAGLEAAARAARYEAIGQLARQFGVETVLLAHHLDDQAETVLLRLLRGAGPDGMGAMAVCTERDGLRYIRPWLGVPRSRILAFMQAYSAQTGFAAVQDPSNLDARHARGVLRAQVLPAIEGHWPGYRTTLERFARLSSEASAVLREVAQADLDAVRETAPPHAGALRLAAFNTLQPARRAMALRRWLAEQGMAAPSEARLQNMVRQLREAADDRQILLRHDQAQMRRYRDWVIVERASGGLPLEKAGSIEFVWHGEESMRFEGMGGTLVFATAESGLDPAWLGDMFLTLRWRRGRERLQVSAQTPSRSLKNLYQEGGIPAWERERLPLLYRGETLVYAAGLGMDARAPNAAPGIALRWLADRPGATVAR